MSERPSWMPKAPRIFLLAIFPVTTFILYLILELGCINGTMSVVSPIIVRSNGSVPIGAQTTAPVDLRIGFWGLCFGPQPFACTSSLNVFQSKSVGQLTRAIPANRGGGNVALARLALGLQANFAILSGIVLFIFIVLDLIANLVQIYFNLREEWEFQIKAAIWARSLDWATASGAIGAFSSYRALLVATPNLLRVGSVVPAGQQQMVSISSGSVAMNLFAGIVGVSVAGAVVNTFLTMQEVGSAVATGGMVYNKRAGIGTGTGTTGGSGVKVSTLSISAPVPVGSKVGGGGGGVDVDVSAPDYVPVYKRRPAYEVFP